VLCWVIDRLPPTLLGSKLQGPLLRVRGTWYVDAWDNSWPETEPRPPNWNCTAESRSDHHGSIATNPMITKEGADVITGVFKNRWRTLMSVDDDIAGVIMTAIFVSLVRTDGLVSNSSTQRPSKRPRPFWFQTAAPKGHRNGRIHSPTEGSHLPTRAASSCLKPGCLIVCSAHLSPG